MPFINIKQDNQDNQNSQDDQNKQQGVQGQTVSPYPSLDEASFSLNNVQEKVEPDGTRVFSRPLTEVGKSADVKPEIKPVPAVPVEPATIPVVAPPAVTASDVPEKIESSTPYPSLEDVKQAQEVTPVAQVEPEKKEEPVKQSVPEQSKMTTRDKFESRLQSAQNIDDYLAMAVEKNASDVHFTPNYPVHFRVDGQLLRHGVDPLSSEQVENLLYSILNDQQKKDLKNNVEIDMVYPHSSGNRFRVNIFKNQEHPAGAFRLIPKKVKTIDELGLPPLLKEFSKIPYGLVVITGPTGSGKSTTIAAMIEEINRTEAKHIITIEDPVEYVFEKRLSVIAQRSMYEDTQGWDKALRAVLRQDPNVVVIGEMRDYETIAAALTIAETGHLVLASLHTNSAAQTIDRIIDVFPEGQQNQVRSQLSNMLSGVVAQRLVPGKDGGRKAAMEILIGTIAVKNAIREDKTHQIDNIIQTSADVGMFSLEKSLVELVRQGYLDIETAKNFSARPDELDLLLR